MANNHCYNCLNAKHCINYGKEKCAYKGGIPEDFEARYCSKDCFTCIYENSCVASCKGEECLKCRFYERSCKGQ